MLGLFLRAGTLEGNSIDRVPVPEIFSLVYNTEMKQTIITSDLRITKKGFKSNYPEDIIFRLS